MRRGADTALALHRFDQEGCGLRTDRLLDRFEIAMRHLVEAIQRRTETFEIFGRAGRRQCPQRAAVERAFEGDEAIALGMSLGGVVSARDLDGALHRFRTRITEEHEVRKTLFAEPRGKLVAVRALE